MDILDPLIFYARGEYRTGGIFPILLPLLLYVTDPFFQMLAGLPLFFAGLFGAVFLHCRTSTSSKLPSRRPFTSVTFALIALSHLLIFIVAQRPFFVPARASIRPMGLAMFFFVASFMSLLFVVPFIMLAAIKEKLGYLGIVALIGAITPFFFGWFIVNLAARLKGFTLED